MDYPEELVTLSGVCAEDTAHLSKEDGKRLSINLPVVVAFHMPCRTKVEHKSITFSVAIGKNVVINLHIGMSFIRVSQMIIDFNHEVGKAKALEIKSCYLIYRSPHCGIPRDIPMEIDGHNALYADMKK